MIKLLKLLQKRQHKKYDFQQRLEDRLEDISFPSLSASLYHTHNVQLTAFLEDMVDFFDYRCILGNYPLISQARRIYASCVLLLEVAELVRERKEDAAAVEAYVGSLTLCVELLLQQRHAALEDVRHVKRHYGTILQELALQTCIQIPLAAVVPQTDNGRRAEEGVDIESHHGLARKGERVGEVEHRSPLAAVERVAIPVAALVAVLIAREHIVGIIPLADADGHCRRQLQRRGIVDVEVL